jgi:hypothetical protein
LGFSEKFILPTRNGSEKEKFFEKEGIKEDYVAKDKL